MSHTVFWVSSTSKCPCFTMRAVNGRFFGCRRRYFDEQMTRPYSPGLRHPPFWTIHGTAYRYFQAHTSASWLRLLSILPTRQTLCRPRHSRTEPEAARITSRGISLRGFVHEGSEMAVCALACRLSRHEGFLVPAHTPRDFEIWLLPLYRLGTGRYEYAGRRTLLPVKELPRGCRQLTVVIPCPTTLSDTPPFRTAKENYPHQKSKF
jgi:hypothetical protein